MLNVEINIKNKLEGILMNIFKKELAKQRTVSLYQYQEDEILKINEELAKQGKPAVSYADIIRYSVDRVLPELKKNL